MTEEINFEKAIKLCHDWLRGNVTWNLLYSGFRMEYMGSPSIEKRGYWLIHCSLSLDLSSERMHYVFMINPDGTIRRIGKGSFDEETNTLTLKEIKIKWVK